MTYFEYYAIILTTGMALYYIILLNFDKYQKGKGESRITEDMDTTGLTEGDGQPEDNPDDDFQASKPYQGDDEKEKSQESEQGEGRSAEEQSEGENPETNEEQVHQDDHPDSPEVSDDDHQVDSPYSEQTTDNTDEGDTSPYPTSEEDANEKEDNSEGSHEESDTAPKEGSSTSDESSEQQEQPEATAPNVSEDLMKMYEEQGLHIEQATSGDITELNLVTPKEEPKMEVKEMHEPDNADAQILADAANSRCLPIDAKSNDAVPAGILSAKLRNKVGKTATNILSREVQEKM